MIEQLSVTGLLALLELTARAGGGGSGGGEGGVYGAALLGYVPCHFTASLFAKYVNKFVGGVVGGVVGLAVSLVGFAIFWPFYPLEAFLIPIGAVMGVVAGVQHLFARIRAAVRKTKQKVTAAASQDPVWHETSLQQTITTTFNHFQNDWTHANLDHIRSYTTPHYFHHVSLMLAAMHVIGRQNQVVNPKIESQFVTDITDHTDNTKDQFIAAITARAEDRLVDVKDNKILYKDNRPFTEYWRFVRHNHTWRLDGIEQATADPRELHGPLYEFAQKHGMFFSLDWGWLLLPQRGQLFKGSRFGMSDINNHIIGQWNGILVQLYTYRTMTNSDSYANYKVAQITLPKSYGGIIIKRKGWFNITPRGYRKVMFEWPDFNNHYVVFATDADKVTSFELLNPKFMAYLYDTQLKVNIEVVDNTVYLYSRVNAKEQRYEAMMQVLQQAFKELRL